MIKLFVKITNLLFVTVADHLVEIQEKISLFADIFRSTYDFCTH